jgi:hypothetical protein
LPETNHLSDPAFVVEATLIACAWLIALVGVILLDRGLGNGPGGSDPDQSFAGVALLLAGVLLVTDGCREAMLRWWL